MRGAIHRPTASLLEGRVITRHQPGLNTYRRKSAVRWLALAIAFVFFSIVLPLGLIIVKMGLSHAH